MIRSSFLELLRPQQIHVRHQFRIATTAAASSSRVFNGTKSYTTSSSGDAGRDRRQQTTILKSPLTWATVFGLTVVGGAFLYYYTSTAKQLEKETEVKSAGKAAVGGPFSLVLDDGTPVTDVDFRGRYMLLYFGFTNCPDICPAELRKMMSVVRRLDAVGVTEQDLVPLFISLDPARDTVEQTRLYVRDFGPRLRGLTGTPQQCENAARAYRVYSSKTSDDEEDYLVDHSIVMYLVDRGGTFADYYVMTVTAEEMAERIAKIVKK